MCVHCSVMSDCLWPMDCSPLGSSVHGDSPGKNIGMGCYSLLQGIFATQGSNLGLPHCRQILYHLSQQGSPSGIVAIRLSKPLNVDGLCVERKQECWVLQSLGYSQAGAMQTRWKEGSWVVLESIQVWSFLRSWHCVCWFLCSVWGPWSSPHWATHLFSLSFGSFRPSRAPWLHLSFGERLKLTRLGCQTSL